MNEAGLDKRVTHETAGEPVRKAYHCPTLREFGPLHLLTQGAGPNNGDSGQTRMTAPGCDPALKQNVVRVGTHPTGIGIYLFDYKPEHRAQFGSGRQLGVMADEVQTVCPQAVSIGVHGFRTVAYDVLGGFGRSL